MIKKSRQTNFVLFIGIMLFALFFGAGNLIFPAMLGQLSGEHVSTASAGFVVTGVVLPLLGVIALSYSGENDFLKVSQRAGVVFGLVFATALYLAIGPLFAIPRTGSVSYEIALTPFVSSQNHALGLGIFTFLYFTLCCLLCINPNRVVDIVGKLLTPLLLICIGLLVVVALFHPMGQPLPAVKPEYQIQPFFTGFTNGYQTMDTLASFIFGIIVIASIKNYGVTENKKVMVACVKSSLIAASILAIVYVSLSYIGANSVQKLGVLDNGGKVLAQVAVHYFGHWGNIVLGIIVTLSCMTTSIGLTISCSEYFNKLFPKISYKVFVVLFSVVSALFANVGLVKLITISVPVLVIVYPLTIVLILLTFLHTLFKGRKTVYMGALYCALVVSVFDGLNTAGISVTFVNDLFTRYLPLYKEGVGWIVPAIVGAVIGYLCPCINRSLNNSA